MEMKRLSIISGAALLMFVCGSLFLSTRVHAERGSGGPFLELSGNWSGAGTIP